MCVRVFVFVFEEEHIVSVTHTHTHTHGNKQARRTKEGHGCNGCCDPVKDGLAQRGDEDKHLNVHLHHGLAKHGCREECRKGNQKVPARDASQVKQRVGHSRTQENAPKPCALHKPVHKPLCMLKSKWSGGGRGKKGSEKG